MKPTIEGGAPCSRPATVSPSDWFHRRTNGKPLGGSPFHPFEPQLKYILASKGPGQLRESKCYFFLEKSSKLPHPPQIGHGVKMLTYF